MSKKQATEALHLKKFEHTRLEREAAIKAWCGRVCVRSSPARLSV